MTKDKLKAFELVITQHLNELLSFTDSKSEKNKLHLHGTTMDDVLKSVNELKDVLEKITNKTFGQCVVCNDNAEVELERLEYDYTTSVCLSHYTEAQIRNLEKDLELTAKVQKDLLPCCIPDSDKIEFSHFSKPAGIVSGDYYDFFELADNRQGLVIADVMGKGISASMLMANIQATLRTLGPESDNMAKLATRLNELFSNNMKIIRFLSLCLISLDVEKGIIEFSNAGHNPPIFWNSTKNEIELLNPTGPAIGLIKNTVYKSRQIKINPGDLVVLYTDGLTEARDNNGNDYGDERLVKYIRENHNLSAVDFVEKLRKSITLFASSFHDDLTLVVFKMK